MAFQPHSFMFQSLEEDHQENIASNPNSLFHGANATSASTTTHGAVPFMMMKRSLSFSGIDDHHHHHHHHHHHQGALINGDQDDLSDDGSQLGEKKKRLNLEQVKTLEKSFEIGNKLEPERKLQLAKALNLQPRQVAIWFQNRRARWKTKQLEKDYDVLRKQFDLLKADNDSLHTQNKKLHAELSALKGRDSSEPWIENHNKKPDQGGDQASWSNNGSDQNSSDNNDNNNNNININNDNNINLEVSRTTQAMNNNNNNNKASSASSQIEHAKNLFPSNLRPSSITQLLQGSSRPSDHHHHQLHQMGLQSDETSFCNLFVNNNHNNNHGGATEVDQADHHHTTAGFWPWPPEQHYFH